MPRKKEAKITASGRVNREDVERLDALVKKEVLYNPSVTRSKLIERAIIRFLDMVDFWKTNFKCQTLECPFYRSWGEVIDESKNSSETKTT